MSRDFIVTKEHRRFIEFANAVRKERTIGICHGDAGVGKTQSGRRYAHWDTLEPFITEWGPRSETDTEHYATANRSRTLFYTPPVLPKPAQLVHEIDHLQTRLGICIDEHLRATGKVTGTHGRYNMGKRVELLIIDEADRLKTTGLEQVRDYYDRHTLGVILIGMPGIDKRLARYPQLYSRVGFAHEYRPLTPEELTAVLNRRWHTDGLAGEDDEFTQAVAIATIARITGGNFRLVDRLLTQIQRILTINQLATVTPEVVEAARESLLIGH